MKEMRELVIWVVLGRVFLEGGVFLICLSNIGEVSVVVVEGTKGRVVGDEDREVTRCLCVFVCVFLYMCSCVYGFVFMSVFTCFCVCL